MKGSAPGDRSARSWVAWRLLVVLLPAAILYAPGLGRGLVSEDFVILRRLAETGFAASAWEQLTGPWLGITFFRFYRPLGTIVLDLEQTLFGTWSPGYLTVQLIAHLAATAVVALIARRLLGDRSGIWMVAGLAFGLHPLGPNAVLFVASFATIFSTVAVLAAAWLFLRWRGADVGDPAKGGPATATASLALLAAGYLTYEGTAVAFALLLGLDLASPRAGDAGVGEVRAPAARIGFHAVGAVVAGACLVARGLALGTPLGGYPAAALGLAEASGDRLLERLTFDLSRLLVPTWGAWHPPGLARGLELVVLAVAAAAAFRWRRRWACAALLGLLWMWLAQLPYGLPSVVPGNGRYAYLAAVGVALLAAAGTDLAVARLGRRAVAMAAGLALAVYGGLLTVMVAAYRQAGEEAARFRAAVLERAADLGPNVDRILLAGEPDFVRHRRGPFAGVPLAQVFHWGLADAFLPPFGELDAVVYPLPRFEAAALAPARAIPGAVVWTWHRDTLEDIELAPAPADLLAVAPSGRAYALRAEAPAGSRVRVVVIAAGHPDLTAWQPAESGATEVALRSDVVRSMQRLYDAPIYAWLEARGDDRQGSRTRWSGVFEVLPDGRCAELPRSQQGEWDAP